MRWVLALFCACAAIFGSKLALAQGRPTLAGAWSAGPLVEQFSVGEWGTPCGPRPTGRDVPGGQVTVREEGEELAIVSDGRTFRTNECWEQLPGVGRISHTAWATERSWQTKCASVPNDPRQTTIVTTLSATETALSLDEVAQYQFRIEGQACTASARRSQTLTLVRRQGGPAETAAAPPGTLAAAPGPENPPGVVSQPKNTAEPAPRPTTISWPDPAASASRPLSKCATPGPIAQVDVSPATKLLRPGERFTFRTTALDANGCYVDPKASFTVAHSSTRLTLLPGGMVQVDADAGDGTADLTIMFPGHSAQVSVEVATPSRYDALLSTSQGDASAAEEEQAATVTTGASLGASSATAQDTAHARKTMFVVLIGVLALGLAALGVVLVRRAPVAPVAMERYAPLPEPTAAGQGEFPKRGGIVSQARPAAPVRSMICPSCRNELAAGSVFCPNDGNRLVAAGGVLSFQGPTIGPSGGICPTCGRGYDPGVKTCPTHGDDLVPVAVYRATAHRATPSLERGKICPSCGGRYGGEAVFCGKDGTALVLVN